jgi:hypothetical protein
MLFYSPASFLRGFVFFLYFRLMQRLIALIFLISFLFSGTEMHELLKVPHLLSHYAEHALESKEISLVDFLKEHYNSVETSHHDSHKDKGCLPFQGKEHVNPMNTLILNSTAIIVFQKTISQENKVNSVAKFFISSFHGTVWQPPKIA